MRTGIAIVAVALASLIVGFWLGREAAPPSSDIAVQLAEIQSELAEIKKARPAAPPQQARRRTGPDPDKIHRVDVAGAPSKGAANAEVTIVEFSDFQCPFCSRVNPTLDRLLKEYPDDVRIVYKHLPLSFHEQALPAAKASMAADRQGKFWEFHDALFRNQRELSDARFEEIAASLGLDLEKFEQDYRSEEVATRVARDMSEARRLGVTGTPGFFVNGRFLSGAQPYDSFKQAVEAVLEADA